MLATPVTSAPKALAICTANVPTPPDAPMTSTVCPAWTRPWSRTACSAVSAEIGTDAACSKETFDGMSASLPVATRAYCAKDASATPNTASPAAKPVTAAPTAATVPARLRPGLACLGRRSPNPAARIA